MKSNFEFWILDFGLFRPKALNLKSRIQHSKFTGAVNRLTGSLVVDSSEIRQELGWVPPFTMEEGLRRRRDGLKTIRSNFEFWILDFGLENRKRQYRTLNF